MIYFSFSEPYFDNSVEKPNNAQMLANVDALFMTEYSEYRINEILRSYASAVSKTALQATAYNSKSDASLLLGLASTIYTASSSNAEVRTWATLPKSIYVRRVDKSNLNELELDDNMKSKLGKNNLVYKRILKNNVVDTKVINIK